MKFGSDKNFTFCKILHLKSIELVSIFLPFSSKYLTHLISSFNKNYKLLMEQILEEDSSPQSVDHTFEEIYNLKSSKKHSKGEETILSRKRRTSTSCSQKSEKRRKKSKHKRSSSKSRYFFGWKAYICVSIYLLIILINTGCLSF